MLEGIAEGHALHHHIILSEVTQTNRNTFQTVHDGIDKWMLAPTCRYHFDEQLKGLSMKRHSAFVKTYLNMKASWCNHSNKHFNMNKKNNIKKVKAVYILTRRYSNNPLAGVTDFIC